MSYTIYIISLALNQTKFWLKVISNKNSDDLNYKIISFDTESSNFLYKKKITFIDADYNIKSDKFNYSLNKIKEKINENFNEVEKKLFHEKIYFGNKNEEKIYKKFFKTYLFFKKYFKYKKNCIFVQEIGGFIPNVCGELFAKKFKFNYFNLESSFFSNHFHILKNTGDCRPKKNIIKGNLNIKKYLLELKKKKIINIPNKDKLHFLSPVKKIFQMHNIKRFFEKQFKQFILKYNFVFDSDILILKGNVNFLINNLKAKKYYKSLECLNKKNFIYFPLHVPNDYALTIRATIYIDQLNLINQIAKKYPGYIFAIKEHPARVGSFNFDKLDGMLKNNKNIVLLNPNINNFKIINKSNCMITINSKSGFEALLYNKKVFALGESFYKKFKGVYFCKNLNIFFKSFKLDKFNKKINYIKDFVKLYHHACKGSLYDLNDDNIETFSKSIKNILNK